MEKLGVGRDDRIVVYDNSPTRNAARGWFMLRHFGAERASRSSTAASRNGSRRAARPKAASRRRATARFDAVERPRRGRQPSAKSRNGLGVPLVDARGRAPLRRHRGGPAPGRRCRPHSRRAQPALRRALQSRRHLQVARRDPATCSSPPAPTRTSRSSPAAVRASPPTRLIFAARLLGNRDTRLYDGSWSEWGADPSTPKETGPA